MARVYFRVDLCKRIARLMAHCRKYINLWSPDAVFFPAWPNSFS